MAGEATPKAGLVAATAATPMSQQGQQELQPGVNQIGYYDAPTPFRPPVAITPSLSLMVTEASIPATDLTAENRRLSMRVLVLETQIDFLYFVLERIVNRLDENLGSQQ